MEIAGILYKDRIPKGYSNRFWIIFIGLATVSSVLVVFFSIYAIFIPIAILALIFFINNQAWLIAMFLILLPIVYYFNVPYNKIFTVVIALAIGFLWMTRLIICQSQKVYQFWKLFSLITIILFIMAIPAINNGITRVEMMTFMRFIIFFIFIIFFYEIYQPKDSILYFVAMTIPLVISTYYLLEIYKTSKNLVDVFFFFRYKAVGLFDNANVYAGVVITVLPIWIAMMIWGQKLYERLLGVAFSIILLPSLILSDARAAYVGFFVTLFAFAIWFKKIKYFITTMLIVLTIMISIPAVRAMVPLALRFDSGLTGRGVIWKNTVEIINKNLLLGIGMGNFPAAYNPYFGTASEHYFAKAIPHAHNQVLACLVNFGVVGGIIITLILYYFPLKNGFDLMRKLSPGRDRIIVCGVLGGIIGLFGRSLFEAHGILTNGYFYPDIIFWILFVILLKTNECITNPVRNVFDIKQLP